MCDYEYINTKRVSYEGGATFVPVCMKCGRYVKADKEIRTNKWSDFLMRGPNATCKRCGRTEMLYEGHFCSEEEKSATANRQIVKRKL